MRYYSDHLNKLFNSPEELEAAEFEAKKKAEEEEAKKKALVESRKADADKVEELRKAAVKANKDYREALADFCKKHGAYHRTYSGKEVEEELDPFNLFDLFKLI